MARPPHNRWVQGNSAGAYTSPVDKFLIHTTEGGSIDGAIAAYRANNSWPHLTVDARVGRNPEICGHLDLDVAARSLRNMAGGVQTNTDGVIQIEVVGNAANPAAIDWAWIGREVVGPICRTKGIPLHSTVSWVPYPASYGLRAAQRLSPAAWTAFQGVLGHQHAPENDHGDPGAIPIVTVLDTAKHGDTPAPEPERNPLEEDDMPYILAGDYVGNYYVDGSGATPIYEQPLIDQLLAQSVPVVRISAATPDQEMLIVNDRLAATDESTRAAAVEAALRLTAIQQVEEREEQRDLANG